MTSPQESLGGRGLDPMLVRRLGERAELRSRSIVLIGPMAAGKSCLALQLSRMFGYRYIDADRLIVARHGPIPEIFAAQGEEGFRRLEADTIASVLTDPANTGVVLSLGGGAPMTARVRKLIQGETVVYLSIDEQTVAPRIRNNTSRPMLQPHPLQRWREIHQQRRPVYAELADITIDASGDPGIAALAEQTHREILRLHRSGTAATERTTAS